MTMMVAAQDFIAAIVEGNVKLVEQMLAADPSLAKAKDKNGVSALLNAVFRSQKSIVELLLSKKPELDMFEAASVGDTGRVMELVHEDHSSLNSYPPFGFFPLGLATFFGHKDTVEVLIAAGADVNLQSRESMKVSSLHSAVAAGRLDIAQILLAHGANPNSKAAQDFRPIHEAAARGTLEFVQLLLDAGAEINARAVDGKTPLAFAMEHKKDAIASFLKARGATL